MDGLGGGEDEGATDEGAADEEGGTKHWEQAQRTDFHEFDGVENDRTGAVGVKRREGWGGGALK